MGDIIFLETNRIIYIETMLGIQKHSAFWYFLFVWAVHSPSLCIPCHLQSQNESFVV